MTGFYKALMLLMLMIAIVDLPFGGLLFMLNTGAVYLIGLLVAAVISLIILFVDINEQGNGKKTAIWIALCLAIGYTFRFYSTEMVRNDKIKLLAVDDIEPIIETIRSGEYPLASEFYAITAGTDNPNVQPFIDWILTDEGQELVEKAGYVSVN